MDASRESPRTGVNIMDTRVPNTWAAVDRVYLKFSMKPMCKLILMQLRHLSCFPRPHSSPVILLPEQSLSTDGCIAHGMSHKNATIKSRLSHSRRCCSRSYTKPRKKPIELSVFFDDNSFEEFSSGARESRRIENTFASGVVLFLPTPL